MFLLFIYIYIFFLNINLYNLYLTLPFITPFMSHKKTQQQHSNSVSLAEHQTSETESSNKADHINLPWDYAEVTHYLHTGAFSQLFK